MSNVYDNFKKLSFSNVEDRRENDFIRSDIISLLCQYFVVQDIDVKFSSLDDNILISIGARASKYKPLGHTNYREIKL